MVRVAPIPSQASLDWSSLSLSELIADWSAQMNLSADWSEAFFTQFPLYYQRNHHHHKESGGARESGKNFGRKKRTRNRTSNDEYTKSGNREQVLCITYAQCITQSKSMTHKFWSIGYGECLVLYWWSFHMADKPNRLIFGLFSLHVQVYIFLLWLKRYFTGYFTGVFRSEHYSQFRLSIPMTTWVTEGAIF